MGILSGLFRDKGKRKSKLKDVKADFSHSFSRASMLVIAQEERIGRKLSTPEHFERVMAMVASELKPKYGLSDDDIMQLMNDYLDSVRR